MTGLVCGAIAMVAGVMARQLFALRENEYLVTHDSLTGLPNRVEITGAVHAALRRAERAGGLTAVLLIDLNDFKQVNDTLGHAAGDQLLVGCGQVLRDNVRGAGIPARLGGDEFAVVIGDLGDPAEAVPVAERIIDAAGRARPLAGSDIGIHASVGISVFTGTGSRTFEDDDLLDAAAKHLLRRADAAMYQAKRAGGGWSADHEARTFLPAAG